MRLLKVLHGDEASYAAGVIDNDHAFDAVLVQELLGFALIHAFAHGDEIVFRHHVSNALVHIGEAHVAIGENADELFGFRIDDRKTRDAAGFFDQDDFAYGHIRMDGDRIDDHAALELLDHLHLVGLFGGRHVAVNDAEAAGLRHGDGEPRFGDGVHGGGNERDVEADAAGQARGGVDVGRQHIGRARFEEHVVKGQSFTDFHGRLVEILRDLVQTEGG